MEQLPIIRDSMTKYPFVVTPKMTVQQAQDIMWNQGLRHLPVIGNESVVGVISDRDIKQAVALKSSFEFLVEDVMVADPYMVKIDTPLWRVAEEMGASKFGCVIIVDEHEHPLGIFTTTDGMNLLAQILKSGPVLKFKVPEISQYFFADALPA